MARVSVVQRELLRKRVSERAALRRRQEAVAIPPSNLEQKRCDICSALRRYADAFDVMDAAGSAIQQAFADGLFTFQDDEAFQQCLQLLKEYALTAVEISECYELFALERCHDIFSILLSFGGSAGNWSRR